MIKNSVVALDPVSKVFFRYDLEKHTYEIYDKCYGQEKQRIDKEIEKLEVLRGFRDTDWRFDSQECEKYRRRGIWLYLLQKECSLYPSFICSKELSSAYADVNYIKIQIDVSIYVNYSRDSILDIKDELKLEERYSFQYDRSEKIVSLNVSLVLTPNEAIKKMKEQINKDFNISISSLDPDNQLVLKAKARKEYFTGNFPLLAYRQVRESLKGMDCLSLVLTEMPKTLENSFPTFVTHNEAIPYQNSYLMFYLPILNSSWTSKLLKPRIFVLNDQKSIKTRKKLTESLLKAGKKTEKMFSGECDWPFRVKICGIDDLFNLFIEGYLGNATNNGNDHPSYVVIPKPKEKSNKKHKTDSTVNKKLTITEGKVKNRAISSRKISIESIGSNFTNYSPGNMTVNDLYNEFKLPFPPHRLFFDVMLLYGDQILKNCSIRTQVHPFKFNARPMEWIEFPLKTSNLPREARLGINVFAVSKTQETFLIGSSIKPIFDESGVLRTGRLGISLWPFYRVEQRLACMQEFSGSKESFNVLDFRDYNHNYSQIFVQFDSFVSEQPSWSLKDEGYYINMFKAFKNPYRKTPLLHKHFFTKIAIRKNLKFDPHGKIIPNHRFKPDPKDFEDFNLLKCKPQIDDLANLEKVLMIDPLEELSETQKRLLFICRDHYKTIPLALPLFLRSVDWTSSLQTSEAYRLLKIWSKMLPEDALSLFNPEYPDEKIRLYATQIISKMSDDDFVLYMPQLTQALTFETHHFSSLGELLIERALKNPHFVGHAMFWALRSQLFIKATVERFGVILEQFIMLCGSFRDQLLNEIQSVQLFSDLNSKIMYREGFQERQKFLKEMIHENLFKVPEKSSLPIDSSINILRLNIDKCKIMNSKKMPLWLTFTNSESSSDPVSIIFKMGDDLRQDILTLQMIKVMDIIWLENGLDLRMKPYRVIVTGDQSGIIEVVPDSETTSEIQKKYGGTLGALRKETLKDFLMEYNPDDSLLTRALDNFIRSCAGYCVASYILGIADRHNGNIMMTHTGHLFHIDFGHFLGNFKTKFGIQRERSSFVFTEEMAFAMGGKNIDRKNNQGFNLFRKYCYEGYNLVRTHGRRLINLFMLMTSAGMPELQNKEEIGYIREMLSLKLTETEACEKFNNEIQNALNNTFRRIDNLIHNIRR
jgi:phosphatidylinositol-4,5-bisphosphate 3-kinase catalytic subunit alpha/beta/delta